MLYSLGFSEGLTGEARCCKLKDCPGEVARSDDRNDRGWSESLRAYNMLHACEMSKEVTETCVTRKALRWEVEDFLASKNDTRTVPRLSMEEQSFALVTTLTWSCSALSNTSQNMQSAI